MKTAVITGCNRGLGLTLLNKFAENGYNIIACCRKPANDFSDYCKGVEDRFHITVTQVHFDLEDTEQIEKGMETIESLDTSIDVLINNAGVNDCVKPLMYLQTEDLEKTFRINYFAPVLIAKSVAGIMLRQGFGCIINISSIMAEGHQPCGSCYDASKAALNQFTKSVAQELAPFSIRVNAIACGVMEGGMSAQLGDKALSKLIKASALKRPARLDEIAEVALFLASDKSSYISGAILPADGASIL